MACLGFISPFSSPSLLFFNLCSQLFANNVHIVYWQRESMIGQSLSRFICSIPVDMVTMVGLLLDGDPTTTIFDAAKESILYSCRHGFSGFAAKLTESEAKLIAGVVSADLPGVVRVLPKRLHYTQTTRSWDLLQVQDSIVNGIVEKGQWAAGRSLAWWIQVAFGCVGIWPEHQSFRDVDMDEIPPNWKGRGKGGYLLSGLDLSSNAASLAAYNVKEAEGVGVIFALFPTKDITSETDIPLVQVDHTVWQNPVVKFGPTKSVTGTPRWLTSLLEDLMALLHQY
ncbi:Peptidase S8 propeptide/proteinase inhibitor I9 [Dillenia turbinata]|uniref:Peptidase S8 propeptide/proteinase inhibitor I9 n=1 Tax=Dillenia turbinata TaxID=194707 RepID=A0AAN8WCT9_9MAGN